MVEAVVGQVGGRVGSSKSYRRSLVGKGEEKRNGGASNHMHDWLCVTSASDPRGGRRTQQNCRASVRLNPRLMEAVLSV